MVIVHRVFRREFRLAPAIVRGVAAADVARADLVADRLDELVAALHEHHTTEDEMVWPKLRSRTHVDTGLVATMERQHAEVAGLLARAHDGLSSWRRTADPVERDALAALLDDVSSALDAHLAQEEREILPLVEQHFSVAEWVAVGERGMASIPKNRLLVFLGYILEETSPEERRRFLAEVPLPGRIAYRLVGERKWRRERDELRGGIVVPAQRRAG
jgi:hypothetical protein